MRVFKNKWFARFARREGIPNSRLKEAIDRAERGLIDADLGGGLIKQRVARPREGRSGGFRMIVVYRTRKRAVFVYGFAKNEQENIEPDELEDLKTLAGTLLSVDDAEILRLLAAGELQEIGS